MPGIILTARQKLLPTKRRFLCQANYLLRSCIKPKLILLYHSISDKADHNDTQSLSIPSACFEEQIRFLHDNVRVFTPNTFSTNDQETGVLITFDDGYEDNFSVAMPILQKYSIKPIVFVSPYYITHTRDIPHWTQALDWIKSANVSQDIPFSSLSKYLKYNSRGGLMIQSFYKTIIDTPCSKTKSTHPGSRAYMTPDEIYQLSANGYAEIGNHTYTHPCLSTLDRNAQLLEMLFAQIQLKNLTGIYPQYFAYPYGSKDSYNRHSIELAEILRFKNSFTNTFGIASCMSSQHRIPRILMNQSCGIQDLQKLLKLLT